MEPIRVIGRVDQAEQIRAALAAAGADARVTTSAPLTAVAETGGDGSAVDVLANGFDTCAAIKKVAPGRPVVIVHWADASPGLGELRADLSVEVAFGPDATVPWPATGAELIAACARAKASAGRPRPRIHRLGLLLTGATLGAVALLAWLLAQRLAGVHEGLFATRALSGAVFTALAWASFRGARASARPRWNHGWGWTWGAVALVYWLSAAAALVG